MELNQLPRMSSPSFRFDVNQYIGIAHELPCWILNQRQLCDLELILNGGFFPLVGFLQAPDYHSVLEKMRLQDGSLWPIPITLDVSSTFADQVDLGSEIALRDPEGLLLAILSVTSIWQPDREKEAAAVFSTTDPDHPGVEWLQEETHPIYIGGPLLKISLPCHYDFKSLRHTPFSLKLQFKKDNFSKIIAFQTRNPMHRAHQELTLRAIEQTGAKLLIHPVVGQTKPGDIDYYIRVKCYEQILKTYPTRTAMLSLLPLAMRMAGPREALWHALIRKNYGCTHFIVGRDHAGPGKNKSGSGFYDPYAAQALALQHEEEIGIKIIPFQEMAYSHQQKRYFPLNEFPRDETPASISGSELRERLRKNLDIPSWFSYPEVINTLKAAYPPKHKQGLAILFTGLPSSGKSTLANALRIRLRELTSRPVTLLDGDIIRTHLSRGLGFSKEDREINILRIGYVAKEIARHGGISLSAIVAPFRASRTQMRNMVTEVGAFIEVYVATPLHTCEQRDRKGMYKKAREGIITQFTGISDPYEAPLAPEITLDTSLYTPEEGIHVIVTALSQLGYIQDE